MLLRPVRGGPGRWGYQIKRLFSHASLEEIKMRKAKGAGGMDMTLEAAKTRKGVEEDLQSFQSRLNVRKLEKDGSVRNLLVAEQEPGAPDDGRETGVLGAGQVVEDDLGLGLGGHVVPRLDQEEGVEFPVVQWFRFLVRACPKDPGSLMPMELAGLRLS
jgi:hypothetical protein